MVRLHSYPVRADGFRNTAMRPTKFAFQGWQPVPSLHAPCPGWISFPLSLSPGSHVHPSRRLPDDGPGDSQPAPETLLNDAECVGPGGALVRLGDK